MPGKKLRVLIKTPWTEEPDVDELEAEAIAKLRAALAELDDDDKQLALFALVREHFDARLWK